MSRLGYVCLILSTLVGGASAAEVTMPELPRPEMSAEADARRVALQRLAEMSIEVTPDRMVQYAAQGDLTVVRNLLAAGVAVSAHDAVHHTTALHNAAAKGHQALVRMLLEMGARVDAVDRLGVTPLTAACFYGQTKVAELLLAAGASLKVPDHADTFPLLAAVQSGNQQLVSLLLDKGASVEDRNAEGLTAMKAAEQAGRTAILVVLARSHRL